MKHESLSSTEMNRVMTSVLELILNDPEEANAILKEAGYDVQKIKSEGLVRIKLMKQILSMKFYAKRGKGGLSIDTVDNESKRQEISGTPLDEGVSSQLSERFSLT